MTIATLTTVIAQPCGHDRRGNDLAPRTFELTRPPEPFNPDPGTRQYEDWDGRDRSRLWGKHRDSAAAGLNREAPLAVVFTDTIQEVR